MVGEIKMNIQDEMDRIFKMQKDNLDNERKFKELADAERKMSNLEQEEKIMNPLAHAVYDQVLDEFISGDTSCFFQTLCEIENLNNPVVKKYMQGYLEENENE